MAESPRRVRMYTTTKDLTKSRPPQHHRACRFICSRCRLKWPQAAKPNTGEPLTSPEFSGSKEITLSTTLKRLGNSTYAATSRLASAPFPGCDTRHSLNRCDTREAAASPQRKATASDHLDQLLPGYYRSWSQHSTFATAERCDGSSLPEACRELVLLLKAFLPRRVLSSLRNQFVKCTATSLAVTGTILVLLQQIFDLSIVTLFPHARVFGRCCSCISSLMSR
jgi:hypothetical protein